MEVKEAKSKIDPKFKFEVARVAGGESIRYCFQCGKCEATCPIRRFEDSYRPAQIIRATLLGLKDMVLDSDMLWLCATCYSCTEKCPQGVRFTDIIRAIRNLATEKGKVHPFFKSQSGAIAKFGRIFEDESFLNEMRRELGLPSISVTASRSEIAQILRNTKIETLVKSEEEK